MVVSLNLVKVPHLFFCIFKAVKTLRIRSYPFSVILMTPAHDRPSVLSAAVKILNIS